MTEEQVAMLITNLQARVGDLEKSIEALQLICTVIDNRTKHLLRLENATAPAH